MSHVNMAHLVTPRPIMEIGERLGLAADELLPYGRYKAKVALSALDRLKGRPLGRYVLVTAINPTPLRRGKDYYIHRGGDGTLPSWAPGGDHLAPALAGAGIRHQRRRRRWGGEPRSFPWTK